jgi:alpha-beta hydrolase superfamily lysophospholipase
LFAAGNLQYTAKKQLKDLANKDVLIMHGVDDPQVNRESSKNYVLRLSSISSRRSEFYKIDGAGHLLLHDLSSPLIYRYIDDFLNINYES